MVNTKAQKKANKAAVGSIEAVIRGSVDETRKALTNHVKQDVLQGAWHDTWKQILSADPFGFTASPEASKPSDGPTEQKDPATGAIEVFSAANHKGEGAPAKPKAPEKPKSRQEAAMNHGAEVKNVGEKALKREHQTDSQKVQELQTELRQHAAKADHSKKMSLAPHTIQDESRHANKQRVTFFEGLVKNAMVDSKRASESGEWLKVAKKKGPGFKANVNLSDEKSQKVAPG